MTLSPATELSTLGAAECAVIVLTAPLELPDPWDRELNSPDTAALAFSKSLRRPTCFLGSDPRADSAASCAATAASSIRTVLRFHLGTFPGPRKPLPRMTSAHRRQKNAPSQDGYLIS